MDLLLNFQNFLFFMGSDPGVFSELLSRVSSTWPPVVPRLPDLLLDLQAARDNGTFSNVLKKYTKPIVLILDEWLLLKLTEAEARNLFELIHKRRKKSSTIFCSQFRESEWYQQICDGESTLADAIMDRISYDSYKIDIESVDPAKDLSMREVYGLDPAMAK